MHYNIYFGKEMSKQANNHSNQCNTNNPSYQGYTAKYTESTSGNSMSNHSNQINPNNTAYQSSRAAPKK